MAAVKDPYPESAAMISSLTHPAHDFLYLYEGFKGFHVKIFLSVIILKIRCHLVTRNRINVYKSL